jgi:hypothetical protein
VPYYNVTLYSISGILVADAGCILQSLSEYIAPHNHIMPLDLGAKGRCVELHYISSKINLTDPFQVVKSVVISLPMRVVSDSYVTVPYMALSSDWK